MKDRDVSSAYSGEAGSLFNDEEFSSVIISDIALAELESLRYNEDLLMIVHEEIQCPDTFYL